MPLQDVKGWRGISWEEVATLSKGNITTFFVVAETVAYCFNLLNMG